MKKILILGVLILLLLCSCRTTKPFGDEQYYQALGMDGDIVVTLNSNLFDVKQYIEADNALIDFVTSRMTRFSVALTEQEDNSYDYYGAVEGSFSKTLVNTALKVGGLSKQKDNEAKLNFYVDEGSGLQFAIPVKDVVLFSSTSVVENYNQTFKDRVKRISDEQALKMACSQIGIYIANPKTMFDLGFDIPQSAYDNIASVLLVMDDNYVSADFKLKTQELADSFSIIIRSSYVTKLKQEGQKVDIVALKEMFTQELDKVSVKDYEFTEEQLKSIKDMINAVLDMIS